MTVTLDPGPNPSIPYKTTLVGGEQVPAVYIDETIAPPLALDAATESSLSSCKVLLDTINSALAAPSSSNVTTAKVSSEQKLLDANPFRKGLKIFNAGTADVYILESTGTAAANNFSDIAKPGVPLYYGQGCYTGEIRGISASGSNDLYFTEFT